MSIAQTNVVALPAVKQSAIQSAIARSDSTLASLLTASSGLGAKLSDFTKAYAKVFSTFHADEVRMLKGAKTPADVKTVKQARYDAEVAFRKATKEKLAGLVDSDFIKLPSIERAMQRAVKTHVATVKGFVPAKSQSEAAQAKSKSRGTKSLGKVEPKAPAKAEPKTPAKITASALQLVWVENIESAYDEVHKHLRDDVTKEVQQLQAAFLKNMNALMKKNFTPVAK